MLTVKITISEEAKQIVSNLKTLPAKMLPRIGKAMDVQNQLTIRKIGQAYLSFPSDGPTVPIGCRAITGTLRSSLRNSSAQVVGNRVVSSIGSNLVYAAAQEFGADIPPHKITAKGKAMTFKIGDRVIFAKSVNHPGSKLPARGFVQRGISDRASSYTKAISAAIVEAWNQP